MIELLLIGALAQVAVVPRGAEELPWPPWRQILSALEEPAIDAFPRDGRVFRFVWVPPFPSMRLFAVRVEDLGSGPRMTGKISRWTGRWTSDGEYNLRGTVEHTVEGPLSDSTWAELRALRGDGFWRFFPAEYPQPVADGAVWVLEGSAGGERLRIVQHVPKASPFKTLCRRMLDLLNPRLKEGESSLARDR